MLKLTNQKFIAPSKNGRKCHDFRDLQERQQQSLQVKLKKYYKTLGPGMLCSSAETATGRVGPGCF